MYLTVNFFILKIKREKTIAKARQFNKKKELVTKNLIDLFILFLRDNNYLCGLGIKTKGN